MLTCFIIVNQFISACGQSEADGCLINQFEKLTAYKRPCTIKKSTLLNDWGCQAQYVDICVAAWALGNPPLSQCQRAFDMQIPGNLSSSQGLLLRLQTRVRPNPILL